VILNERGQVKGDERIRPLPMIALAGPAMPMFALMMPLTIFIPPFYAEHMGLGMAMVGTLFTLGRLFDVLTDPLAGFLMDRTQQRLGRHVWVTIGAVPLGIATWQIFFAQAPAHAWVLMAWLVVLYGGWTLMSVGLFSWGAEVTSDYDERSRVMGFIQFANVLGTVLVVVLPVVVELSRRVENVDVARVRAMGGFIMLLLPLTLALAWWKAPRVHARSVERSPILPALRDALGTAAIRRLLLADLAVGIGIGSFTALTVFFVEIVLAHPDRAGSLQLILMLSSMLGIPLWIRLARKLQKHRTLSITSLITAAGGAIALVVPPSAFGLAIAAYVVFGIASSGGQMLPRAIMADLLDADRLASGDERAGLLFSLLTTTLKIGLAAGVGITFGIAGAAGFDPAAARQDAAAHWVIRLLIGGIPLVLGLGNAALMWNFPFDRESQRSARSRLVGEERA
jgi:Na+/melibiose symporter-like transporter